MLGKGLSSVGLLILCEGQGDRGTRVTVNDNDPSTEMIKLSVEKQVQLGG